MAASPALAQTATPSPAPAGPTYVVQAGDSLYSIALSFGLTVDALQQANAIADPSLLSVGQSLVIPGYENISGVLTIHRAEVGETPASIAQRFGVSPELLTRLNRLTNPAMMYVGQPIIYPEGNTGIPTGRAVAVMPRDSVAALAARSGQSVWGMALLNDLASPFAAYAGQQLIIASDAPALTGLPQPLLALTLKPEHPVQGGTLEVAAQALDAAVSGSFGPWPLRFADDVGGPVALQGIYALADPGLYPLVITATVPGGGVTVFEQMIPVADGSYPYQLLYVGEEQAALLDPAVVGAELGQVTQIVSPDTEARQWQGTFLQPVQSDRVTTGFGVRRSYNGGSFDGFHGGIDWGATGGSPIVAAAAGTVVFAGPLTVRGNATIIDHGWGVYTGYWHQFKIDVAVGQAVQAGDVIGAVGSSGLSTGSHLHFEVWVGGVQVNPQQWLDAQFP
ncbi:MAG: peptidoglycan DD-metalloendopeptidase family protein [Chloroflexi bacterium]|nr:peptidoglycan DD-metalloendopeptidase family protein [Chloroflexota bacterium]MBI2975625.1 peptidoglycan DD-metalloendopeptidase family protein [Chloroflexota bacterium]